MELNHNHIAERIKYYRQKQGITQAKLAEKVDVSTLHISFIETKRRKASLATINKIANALGVTINDLICSKKQNTTITNIFDDCTSYELTIILDIIVAVKESLRNNQNPSEQ